MLEEKKTTSMINIYYRKNLKKKIFRECRNIFIIQKKEKKRKKKTKKDPKFFFVYDPTKFIQKNIPQEI